MANSATITISVGERAIEVPLKDSRSLGFMANGAASQLERLHDDHGDLNNPDYQPYADDLVQVMNAARGLSCPESLPRID